MTYHILRTDKANDHLFSILHYIAEDSGSVDVALRYLDVLETEIKKLATSPHMGSYPRYSTLRKQGFRVLIVQRHLIFYKVDDEQRSVRRCRFPPELSELDLKLKCSTCAHSGRFFVQTKRSD